MGILALALMGIGGLMALIGIFTIFVPIIGVPLIMIGGFIIWLGQLLKRKAREEEVRRQLGG